MSEVVLERVCKQFVVGGPLVVRDVSLRIADGDLVALVGPSGCGKSTLLRLIAGLEVPTRGEIRIGGRSVTGVPPREREVAMTFQDSALYPHMTAAENMAFALRMRGLDRAEIDRRVRRAAQSLRIADLLERRPGTLSGGQRQRIALGRALVRLPEAHCLLLDEPLSHLDADLRADMREQIRDLHQQLQPTMIFVTHDRAEAGALAQRVVRMADGGLLADSTIAEAR